MSEPGVSVVIPAYNYGRFVGRAVDSVLRQSYSNFELLVVDDGSTDNTPAVLTQYADPRMRCIRKVNAGLSAARNTGIAEARFPFVAFLDADDEWLPSFLETAMKAFEEIGPSFALVACIGEPMDAEGRPLPLKLTAALRDCEWTVRDILIRTRFMPSSVVVRRSVFEECGDFDTSLRSSEDRDMWIRIGARHRLYCVGKILVRICKHDSNMSRNATRMKSNMRRVLWKAFRARVVPAWNLPFWLRVFAFHFLQISWTHFDEGRRLTAILQVTTSLVLWPFPLGKRASNGLSMVRPRALARFILRPVGS